MQGVVALKGRLVVTEIDEAYERMLATERRAARSERKVCPFCGEPIRDVSTTCHGCAMFLRDLYNQVKRTMDLILPAPTNEEALERVRERLARRGIVRRI